MTFEKDAIQLCEINILAYSYDVTNTNIFEKRIIEFENICKYGLYYNIADSNKFCGSNDKIYYLNRIKNNCKEFVPPNEIIEIKTLMNLEKEKAELQTQVKTLPGHLS